MNILIVTPWKLSATGGISTVVTMLSRQFRKKGHDVTVLVTDGENRVLPFDRTEDAPVYGVYLRTPYVETATVRGVVSFCLFFPVTLYQLYRFLTDNRIDIVVIQYPLSNVFYFAILRRLCTWKLIVVYQGNDAHDLHLWNSIDRRLIRFLLMTSDCIIGVSKTLLSKVCRVFPDLQRKTSRIVPNGAPLDFITQAGTVKLATNIPSQYILTAGHLIHRKGVDLLLKALKMARDRGHEMNLVVAGDGPERVNLVNLAEESGISKNVYFVGNQTHGRVLELMKNSLFFVLASRAEGMPLVVAEAMACGKAVICTNVDGVPEIVKNGQTGLLVEPENPQSLAKGLITLSENPALCQTLGDHGKEWAWRKYSWETIADKYLQLFSE